MASTEAQNNEIEIYVPTRYTGNGFFYLNKKHLLSASYVQESIEQNIPIFTVMQQPPLTFGLSNLIPKIMDGAPRVETIGSIYHPENFQALIQKPEDYKQVIEAIPISFLPPANNEVDVVGNAMGLVLHLGNSQASRKRNDYTEVIQAVPISYIPPRNSEVYGVRNDMRQIVNYGEPISYVSHGCEFSLSERKQDWLEEHRTREHPSARTDKYYYFIKSRSIMFRSLTEVFNFIAYGAMPKRNVKRRKLENPEEQPAESSSRRTRGNRLVSKTRVGYYDPSRNVFRRMVITGDQIITEMGYLKTIQDWTTDPMHPDLANFLQRYPNAVIPLYDFELLQ